MRSPLKLIKKTSTEDNNPTDCGDLSGQEITELVLEDICGTDVSLEDNCVFDFTVMAEDFEIIQRLPTYDSLCFKNRHQSILQRYDDQYTVQIRVTVTDTEVEVTPQCLFYSSDTIDNGAVCEFIRRFGHRGPNVKVDLESSEPLLRAYTN